MNEELGGDLGHWFAGTDSLELNCFYLSNIEREVERGTPEPINPVIQQWGGGKEGR